MCVNLRRSVAFIPKFFELPRMRLRFVICHLLQLIFAAEEPCQSSIWMLFNKHYLGFLGIVLIYAGQQRKKQRVTFQGQGFGESARCAKNTHQKSQVMSSAFELLSCKPINGGQAAKMFGLISPSKIVLSPTKHASKNVIDASCWVFTDFIFFFLYHQKQT